MSVYTPGAGEKSLVLECDARGEALFAVQTGKHREDVGAHVAFVAAHRDGAALGGGVEQRAGIGVIIALRFENVVIK